MAYRKSLNEYKINGDTTILFYKNRKGKKYEILIDTEDLDKLIKLNKHWNVASDGKTPPHYYAKTMEYLGIFDGKPKYKAFYLHDIIMDAQEGDYVDHKKHDTLNNKKNNLRITKQDANAQNRLKANKNNKSSGYRNVSWAKGIQKWLVQLQVDGKNKVFGKFNYEDLDKAIKLAEIKRKEIYGKYCNGDIL